MLSLNVGIFIGHPLFPLSAHVLTVTLETSPQPLLSGCFHPDAVREVWPERFARGRDSLHDDVTTWHYLVPLGQRTTRPVIPPIPSRLVHREWLKHLLNQQRPPIEWVVPAREVVGADYPRAT